MSGNTKSCGCLASEGERIIQSILEQNNISFKKQKTFQTCFNPKTNALLKFDFYLPDYNCCIEFDGIQHYKEQFSWYYSNLEDVQYRDNIKNN